VSTTPRQAFDLGDRSRCHGCCPVAGGALLAATLSPSMLSSHGTGVLRPRFSRIGGRYLSNGCLSCDAIQGSFPLAERLFEYERDGHTLSELPCIAAVELRPALRVAGWSLADDAAHSYPILSLG
jgi:hypothetical protein